MAGLPQLDANLTRASCGDGDLDAMEALCSRLLTLIERGQGLPVVTGKALSLDLINNFIYRMVRRCHLNGLVPPERLWLLMQRHLGQAHTPGMDERGNIPCNIAARYLAANPDASDIEIAAVVGRTRQTVWRWRQEAPFQEQVKAERQYLESVAT
jgi:hypothetical protein